MRQVLVLPLVPLLSVALIGCGGGQARSDSTAATAAATSASVQEAGLSLDGLTQALTNFRGASASADLKQIYKSFASEHDAVAKAIAAVTKGATSTEAKARAQLDEWNKLTATIQDPELRASTTTRSASLRTAVEELASSHGVFKSTSGAFLTRIGDIRKVLDLDLTTGGIAAIKPSLTKAIDATGGMKTGIADLAAKVKTITDLLARK